jgi:hypothetical protein
MPRGKDFWYPLDGSLGGSRSWYGHWKAEKCVLSIEPQFFCHSAHSLVANWPSCLGPVN